MKSFVRTLRFRLFLYTIFYFLFMSYGLDLVQSQGSQILPFIAWLKNPEAFQNDIMGMTFPYYSAYSIWYKSAEWFSAILPPMGVIYVLFFIQCLLEVYGLHFLSRRVFSTLPASYSWIVIILFTFGGVLRHSLGSAAPFGWTVFPDTLATGILLFALGYFLDKKYLLAFLITAVSFHVHLSLTLFVLIIFSGFYLMEIKSIPVSKTLRTGLLSLLIVAPLAAGILSNPLPPPTGTSELWLSSVRDFQGMHSFPSKFGFIQYIPFLFWLTLLLISLKYLEATGKLREVMRLCIAACSLLLIAAFFIEIVPVKTVIVLSFFRGSRIILIFSVICSVALFCQFYEKKLVRVVGISAIAFFVFVNIVVFHPVYRIYPQFVTQYIENIEKGNNPARKSLLYQTLKQDRRYVSAWKDVQLWCRDNTPDDVLILTPYYLRGFRSFYERGIVFQFRDSQLHIYYEYLFEDIIERTRVIGMQMDRYHDPTEYQVALEDYYKSYTRDDVEQLAEIYGYSYVVTEKDHRLALPLKYGNEHFNVFSLSDQKTIR